GALDPGARRSHPLRSWRQSERGDVCASAARRLAAARRDVEGVRMSLTVVDPGWATRLVDRGRPGSRSLGVPVSGAADRASWMLGNALVGNPPEAAALELA